MSRGRLEREHHWALPQRAGRDGQQQLPWQLRCGREGRTCGIQPGGAAKLQVSASLKSWVQFAASPDSCHVCRQVDSRHRKIRWHCRHPTQGGGVQSAEPADQLCGAGHSEAVRFGVTDYNHVEEFPLYVVTSQPVLESCKGTFYTGWTHHSLGSRCLRGCCTQSHAYYVCTSFFEGLS